VGRAPHPVTIKAAAIFVVGLTLGSTLTSLIRYREHTVMRESAIKQCLDMVGKVRGSCGGRRRAPRSPGPAPRRRRTGDVTGIPFALARAPRPACTPTRARRARGEPDAPAQRLRSPVDALPRREHRPRTPGPLRWRPTRCSA
jgi:hypothetical protein